MIINFGMFIMNQNYAADSVVNQNLKKVKTWHVLVTKGNHAKKVNSRLISKKIETYLPLVNRVRQWRDRRRIVEQPVFGNYIFVHVNLVERLMALQTKGCARYVTFGNGPAVVRNDEIENMQNIFNIVKDPEIVCYEKVGELVEIVRGPLRGVQGVVERHQGKQRIFLSLKSINHSIVLDVNAADIKLVETSKNANYNHG